MLPQPELSELPDDVLGDILLRLPPDDPACFLRASLVCKSWRRILADPEFHRTRGALHRRPSFLGILYVVNKDMPFCSRFVPNNPTSRRPAARDLPGWLVLDCRHGRALFATASPSLSPWVTFDFLVWDPLTDEQRRLPRPSPPPTVLGGANFLTLKAAVLCAAAAEGCDHSGCHGGAFIVVFLSAPNCFTLSARVYSSETGNWSKLTSCVSPFDYHGSSGPSAALVGDTLYFHGRKKHAFKYHLGTEHLSVIDDPPPYVFRGQSICPMTMEDGGLRFTGVEDGLKSSACLCLCSREEGQDEVAQWAQLRAIELAVLLPDDALDGNPSAYVSCNVYGSINAKVVGFVDGTDVCFVGVRMMCSDNEAVYFFELNSGRARKVLEDCAYVFPYTSFCIPVIEANSTREGPSSLNKLKMLMRWLLNRRIFRFG
ncbi:hypothetical protein EJB05_34139, partial [Eragrostis curvula]